MVVVCAVLLWELVTNYKRIKIAVSGIHHVGHQ